MGKSQDRLDVLKRIEEKEKYKLFNEDVENDPESKILMPNQIDYLNKKLSSKIKTGVANIMGTKFFESQIKNGQFIIKNIVGIEHFTNVQGGALLTCNHFNACDNYAVYRAIKPYMKGKRLWKVIREGNYTNFPGLIGFLFRNCNTLPLSSNIDTMKMFFGAMNTLLARGEKILIYPEKSMWWNYRKPRPLLPGAYKFAVNNNVPIIPVFITMEDSQTLDPNGFFVQEYTINFAEPIYPNPELSKSENIKYMQDKNYQVWVDIYEKFYNTKLEFITKEI